MRYHFWRRPPWQSHIATEQGGGELGEDGYVYLYSTGYGRGNPLLLLHRSASTSWRGGPRSASSW
ncbi:hypothetical protein ACFVJ8_01615 [Streptomyces yangpuensis]|uniref:hypothetical protein n=1 Tax=Streptomyces TaxID=1883 RepID=UPI0004C9FAF0|nr:hypothetical protein [Streptomyces sp. NRRL S-378]